MWIFFIFLELVIIAALASYIITLKEKLDVIKKSKKNVEGLKTIEDLVAITSENISFSEKILKINGYILKKYKSAFSSIVVFNGKKFEVLASNVEKVLHNNIENYYLEVEFKNSVYKKEPVHLKVKGSREKLMYQHEQFSRAKSAIFLPMHVEDVLIGYWILEDDAADGLDKLEIETLEIIKNTILDLIKLSHYQKFFENLTYIDKYSEMESREYLFSTVLNDLNNNKNSLITMIKLLNIEEINEKYGRDIGNTAINEVSKVLKNKITKGNYIVRYMGTKFVIAFPGAAKGTVDIFLKQLKSDIENIKIKDLDLKLQVRFLSEVYYTSTDLSYVTKELERKIEEI